MRELARAELGEIDAIAGAQTADLAFVIRTLRRIAPRLVDEAVPSVGVDYARLFGPAPRLTERGNGSPLHPLTLPQNLDVPLGGSTCISNFFVYEVTFPGLTDGAIQIKQGVRIGSPRAWKD